MGVKIILTNGNEHFIPDVAEVTDKVVEELAKLNIETMVTDSLIENSSVVSSIVIGSSNTFEDAVINTVNDQVLDSSNTTLQEAVRLIANAQVVNSSNTSLQDAVRFIVNEFCFSTTDGKSSFAPALISILSDPNNPVLDSSNEKLQNALKDYLKYEAQVGSSTTKLIAINPNDNKFEGYTIDTEGDFSIDNYNSIATIKSLKDLESALIGDLTSGRTYDKAEVYIPNITILTGEPLPATGTPGDYCIITDTQTAYMYMEDHWEALNGNYDATNVYFPDNFKITQSFGKYTVASGESTTLPWKNKSILDAFKDALSVAVVPVASLPSLTVTWKNFTAKEVGTAISTSSDVVLGTLKVDVGKYTEVVPNQDSDVTFNNISIDTYLADIKENSRNSSYNNVSANTTYDIVWSFDSIPVFDEEGVSFGCDYYGDYTEGAIPTDSLGNDCEDKRISAGTCGTEADPKNSVTTTNRFIGYRNWWYGYVTDFNTDSNTITRLANGDVTFNGTKLTAANTATKTGYIPGCSATAGLASGTTNKAFVVVVPTSANLKISGGTSFGVSNVNMDATYFNKIIDTNLKINGVNNFEAAQYDILVYNPTDISDMTISYTLGEDK